MKKNLIVLLLCSFSLLLITLPSCSSDDEEPEAPKKEELTPLSASLFSASPSPLEAVGGKVPVTINGSFPANWFHKDATVTIIPVLKYAGGEATGTSKVYRGESVSGEGTVIKKEAGGDIIIQESFNYIPEMKKSELYLRFEVTRDGKSDEPLPEVKIADGVIAT